MAQYGAISQIVVLCLKCNLKYWHTCSTRELTEYLMFL